MRNIILILTFFSTTLISYSQTDRSKLGVEYVKQELENTLNNSSENQILGDTVVKSQETAIKYAETILFEI